MRGKTPEQHHVMDNKETSIFFIVSSKSLTAHILGIQTKDQNKS